MSNTYRSAIHSTILLFVLDFLFSFARAELYVYLLNCDINLPYIYSHLLPTPTLSFFLLLLVAFVPLPGDGKSLTRRINKGFFLRLTVFYYPKWMIKKSMVSNTALTACSSFLCSSERNSCSLFSMRLCKRTEAWHRAPYSNLTPANNNEFTG